MSSETALVWFRRDLRVHDNEALAEAAAAAELLPVYCFDPREYGRREFGGSDSFAYRKTGSHRAAFRRESVADLRERLRERGSDLLVRHGRPEAVLPELAAAVGADRLLHHTYPTAEESTVERRVRDALPGAVDARRVWGHTLYHPDDLPVDYREVSDTFTPFRKNVEANASVREPLAPPTLPPLPEGAGGDADGGTTGGADGVDLPSGDVPALATLDSDLAEPTADERGVLAFEGGETAALERLEEYVWTGDNLRTYKETRNGLVGPDYSSKLSAWLSEGCLSPRYVEREVDRYEERRVANDSTYWLVFELLWRDFYQFQFAKHGSRFFAPGGIRRRDDVEWRDAPEAFERWAAGETGIPFVDANVRELNATGYMSNRGRQNVASFLANNLRVDWRRGAAYFETRLVDYDPCSNYGNWAYVAGVGNDSRDRYFDVLDQARRYDGDAAYVKRWCPALEPLPPEYAHAPWELSEAERAEYGVELGRDYPRPMLDLEASYERLRE
jgi:deoxyribodipyrimidine photo-lyase